MRKSIVYLCLTVAAGLVLASLIGLHPMIARRQHQDRQVHERRLVGRLALTDLSLFTEAPYLRNPNMADRFTAFQNHPMAISLFPSESLLPPPNLLTAVPAIDPEGARR